MKRDPYADKKFGDVYLRRGLKGWYVTGYRRFFGVWKSAEELENELDLIAMEAVLEQAVKDGYIERVECAR